MRAPDQCVILIGGLGTRLGPLTADTPKPLLPIGNRPFLEYLLVEVARFGFKKVLLLAGYRADRISNYLSGDVFPAGAAANENEVSGHVEGEEKRPASGGPLRASANRNRGKLPLHLPRVEIVIDVDNKCCPCCGGRNAQDRRDDQRNV